MVHLPLSYPRRVKSESTRSFLKREHYFVTDLVWALTFVGVKVLQPTEEQCALAVGIEIFLRLLSWQAGVNFDHTSLSAGLLIQFDSKGTPVPENCTGASSGWMFIRESRKTIIAVTLTAISLNNRTMTVYTNGITADEYCEVNQVDPAGQKIIMLQASFVSSQLPQLR